MSNHIELDSVYRDRQCFSNPCDYNVTAEQVATWIANPREVRVIPQNPGERPMDFVSSLNLINVVLPYPRIELFAPTLIVLDSISGGNTLHTILPHGLNINDIVMTSSPGFGISLGIFRNVEYHVIATPTPTSFQVSLTQAGPIQLFNNGTGINLQLAVITPANYNTIIALNDDAALLTTFPRIYLDIHSELYKDIRRVNSINGSISDAKFALIHDKVQYDENLTPIWILYRSHGEQVMRFKRNNPLKIRFFSRAGNTITFFDEPDLTIPTNPYKQSIITVLETPYIRDAVYSNHATNPIS